MNNRESILSLFFNNKNKEKNIVKDEKEIKTEIKVEIQPIEVNDINTNTVKIEDETTTLQVKDTKKQEQKSTTETKLEPIEIVAPIPLIKEEIEKPKEEVIQEPIVKPINNTIEVAIIEEIDEFIKDEVSEINEIEYKIKVLNQKQEDAVLLEDIEKIRKELDELIKKLERIKKEFESYYKELNLKELDKIDNDILEVSIKDYIYDTKEGIDTSKYFDQIKQIDSYMDVINKLVELDIEKDKLDDKVDEKLDTFEIRDEEFEDLENSSIDLDKVNDEVDKLNYEIDKAIIDINKKIEETGEIERRIEESTRLTLNFNRIINGTVIAALSTYIPPTPLGRYFKLGMIANSAYLIMTSLQEETTRREIVNVTWDDYIKDIEDNQDLLNKSLDLVTDSLDRIEDIKSIFDSKFSEYKNQIPEYYDFIQNIIKIEKELERQEQEIKKYQTEMDETLDKNKEKVKTMEQFEEN